jgi:hypothetical protein
MQIWITGMQWHIRTEMDTKNPCGSPQFVTGCTVYWFILLSLYNDIACNLLYIVECLVYHESETAWKETAMA